MNKKLNEKIKTKLKNKKPKPKWQFQIFDFLKDFGIILLFISAILIFGIALYLIVHYNPFFGNYKNSGFNFFFQIFSVFPWELIGILVLLILGIYYLIKKVHFLYRLDSILIIVIILVLTTSGYFLAETTGLNKKIAGNQIIREIYQKQGRLFKPERGPVVIGEILKIENDKITIQEIHSEKEWIIIFDEKTRIQKNQDLEIGKTIMVIGEKKENQIKARGIKFQSENFRGFNDFPRPESQRNQMPRAPKPFI